MPDTTFGFGEVLHLTEARRGQLMYWTQARVVRANVRDTRGTGHHRVFSFHNLVEVRVAVALARYGVSLESLKRVLGALGGTTYELTQDAPDQLLRLMGDPHTVTPWVGTRAEFIDEVRAPMLTYDPVGILIDLRRVVADMQTRVERGEHAPPARDSTTR